MNAVKPFISIDKHGTVTITGGVVFCANVCIDVEAPTADAGRKSPTTVDGTAFYTAIPKWWQIVKWFRLLQVLRRVYQ